MHEATNLNTQKSNGKLVTGNSGHGSRFVDPSAGDAVRFVLDKILEFRRQQEAKLEADPELKLGDVSTVNVVKISGGGEQVVV